MKSGKLLYPVSQILILFCIAAAWLLLLIGDIMFPASFGALPAIVMAAMMTGNLVFVLCIILCVVVYGLVFVGFYFGNRHKRWGMVAGTLALCFDMATMVVFTAFSWGFLIGVLLDAVLIGTLWKLTLTKKR